MVAKDDHNRPTEVPPLLLETREDARRFLEAIKRRELRNLYQQQLNNAKTILEVDTQASLLENERCVLGFKL